LPERKIGGKKSKIGASLDLVILNPTITVCSCGRSMKNVIIDYSKKYLLITVSPPTISKHPSTMNISVFGSVSFECTAEGFNVTEVTWQRVGCALPLTATISNTNSTNKVTSILRITKSSGYYSGQYYCTARNSAGTVKSQQASLHVDGT